MKEKKGFDTKSMVLCALFTALIAAGAFIKIPVPMVPFTLQFLFTNMAGLLLGKRYGFLSVALYMLIGLIGIPVFTAGGGPGYIFQPTFGYIIGMACGAWVAGYVVERGNKGMKSYLTAGFINLAIVYIFGMIYYYFMAKYHLGNPIGAKALLIYCCLVFLPGDGLSCVVGALLAKRLRPIAFKKKAVA
ncbi:MAG: biotin transporter BioY [Oscillospiraceae bacterium]